jgi:DNA-binding NarL/FixJ family response regulator
MMIPATQLADLLVRARERSHEEAERMRLRAEFTPREREVLLLMAEGLDNKTIGRELGLRVTTRSAATSRTFPRSLMLTPSSRRWRPLLATTY